MDHGQLINAAMTTSDRFALTVGTIRGMTCRGSKGRPWVQ